MCTATNSMQEWVFVFLPFVHSAHNTKKFDLKFFIWFLTGLVSFTGLSPDLTSVGGDELKHTKRFGVIPVMVLQ